MGEHAQLPCAAGKAQEGASRGSTDVNDPATGPEVLCVIEQFDLRGTKSSRVARHHRPNALWAHPICRSKVTQGIFIVGPG